MSHQNSTWTIKLPHGQLLMLQSRYWLNAFHLNTYSCLLYSSFTSTCRPLSDGAKFMEDLITVAFITTLLTFLKTCQRALWRKAHRIYLSGGICRFASHAWTIASLSLFYFSCRKVFPAAATHQKSSTAASRKAMKEQRAARHWCNFRPPILQALI